MDKMETVSKKVSDGTVVREEKKERIFLIV